MTIVNLRARGVALQRILAARVHAVLAAVFASGEPNYRRRDRAFPNPSPYPLTLSHRHREQGELQGYAFAPQRYHKPALALQAIGVDDQRILQPHR